MGRKLLAQWESRSKEKLSVSIGAKGLMGKNDGSVSQNAKREINGTVKRTLRD